MFKTENLIKVFYNYFWIVIISAIVEIAFGKGYIISIIFPLLLFLLAYKSGRGRKSFIDILFFLILFSMVISWIINSYSNKTALVFRCIMAEGSYMSAYFIGKKLKGECLHGVFEKALIPLAICCVLGIYFFFNPPGWYLAQLYNSEMFWGNDLSLELLRLRSIFSSPYVMAYMCGMTSLYLLFKIFQENNGNLKIYALLGLYIITMMFCMMRAPLGCVFVSLMIFLFYYCRYKGSIKIFFITLISFVFVAWIAKFALQSVNVDVLDFIISKFESATTGRSDLISERVSMWNYSYHILGDGAGRHAILADNYNVGTSIRDSEYVKILVEQGYLGLSLYIALISICIIKCIVYFKELPLELCLVIFFAITMIGANPLSTADKHCFIFWLTVGRIAAFKPINSASKIKTYFTLRRNNNNMWIR